MYFPIKSIDISSNEGIRNLISDLLIQQYETDLNQWEMYQRFHENKEVIEFMDNYPLCNWMIVYNLMGFKEVPDDLKIYHGHIARHYFKRDLSSPVARMYADMILNDEKYSTGEAEIQEDIDKLIDLIYTFKK